MRNNRPFVQAGALASALLLHGAAHAINGAQLGGSGIKNASMGGASIALPLDATAAANNPAGMAFVPTSATFDVQVFHGQTQSDYALPGNRLDTTQTIPAPEGGFNYQLSQGLALGFSFTTSGAGADFGQALLPVPGASNAKSKLTVFEFVPTIAWKPRDDLAVGLGLTLAREQLKVDGVIVQAPVPGGLLPVSGHGNQTATGAGWRMGVMWQPSSDWTIGANYKARTSMSRLDGYGKDLLAYSDGKLDLPEQYGIGVAWRATPSLTLAADWLRIKWGGLKAMQDPNGFGWRDQPVLRLGASWAMTDRLTLRAGFSRNRSQIDSTRTVQNVLVPSITEKAWSTGLTWAVDQSNDLSLGYELNPQRTLTGTGSSQGTNLTSKAQLLMVGWQRRF